MQFLKFTLFVIPFLTAVSAAAVDDSAAVLALKIQDDADASKAAKREPAVAEENIEKRVNCPGATDNGCRCRTGYPQGQYCGYCYAVVDKGSATYWGENSFECRPNGDCCYYGYTRKCDSSTWSDWCPR